MSTSIRLALSISSSTVVSKLSGVASTDPQDVTSDFWFDANNVSYMYTDPFQTTNVSSSGQTIGYIVDVAESGVE